ncbi:16S rRNA (guanine(966)-N(2))-methyltransferase RsmD [Mycoplasma marinum]|uniref:16S rRNA (Guanine(966)-N(2))-methyltransferase RsmD n=1 Tax=Mycoplasma marinum TaxID=1937190 RepID=A0A4V6N9J7_9MOLU|nr:16S rRNA (guanine(966)-N(2))-methyltransferase RsmD [Mycoplasma marinum]TCG10688.1 16S rRNA (guanine(966)-N(2))-methyltransferase RsmD [Mycoplasma marinum]
MLRIISGKYGGRQIEQPEMEITRATTDRIREAIFSSIQFDVPNSLVLDLFSGSGAFALEAVSRGAMKAIAIEKNSKAINIIKSNKDLLKINNMDIIKTDAISYVKSKSGAKFNLIFMDPPYEEIDLYNQTLEEIKKSNLLATNGYIILETDRAAELIIPDKFMIQKSKKYGKISVLLISNV